VIVHINSYPGVGKLTIGRALAELIGGRLLDNHSVFNVAFALTEFRSPVFYDTVRAVREIAYQRILDLPPGIPVVLTNWFSQGSAWGEENWDRAITLAKARGSALNVVLLACSPEENARRIVAAGRAAKRKPQDVEMVDDNRRGRPLLDRGADRLLRLDVTNLAPDAAAREIAAWLSEDRR
jgi:hypothetical protein